MGGSRRHARGTRATCGHATAPRRYCRSVTSARPGGSVRRTPLINTSSSSRGGLSAPLTAPALPPLPAASAAGGMTEAATRAALEAERQQRWVSPARAWSRPRPAAAAAARRRRAPSERPVQAYSHPALLSSYGRHAVRHDGCAPGCGCAPRLCSPRGARRARRFPRCALGRHSAVGGYRQHHREHEEAHGACPGCSSLMWVSARSGARAAAAAARHCATPRRRAVTRHAPPAARHIAGCCTLRLFRDQGLRSLRQRRVAPPRRAAAPAPQRRRAGAAPPRPRAASCLLQPCRVTGCARVARAAPPHPVCSGHARRAPRRISFRRCFPFL